MSSSKSAVNSTSNYTSESTKLLLMSDNTNHKVIPNQSKRASVVCWKRMEMDFPVKKSHDRDELYRFVIVDLALNVWRLIFM